MEEERTKDDSWSTATYVLPKFCPKIAQGKGFSKTSSGSELFVAQVFLSQPSGIDQRERKSTIPPNFTRFFGSSRG